MEIENCNLVITPINGVNNDLVFEVKRSNYFKLDKNRKVIASGYRRSAEDRIFYGWCTPQFKKTDEYKEGRN
jgi:hypothetical protein